MKPAVPYETDSLKALYTVKHYTGLLAPDSHYDIIVLEVGMMKNVRIITFLFVFITNNLIR